MISLSRYYAIWMKLDFNLCCNDRAHHTIYTYMISVECICLTIWSSAPFLPSQSLWDAYLSGFYHDFVIEVSVSGNIRWDIQKVFSNIFPQFPILSGPILIVRLLIQRETIWKLEKKMFIFCIHIIQFAHLFRLHHYHLYRMNGEKLLKANRII